MNGLMKRLMAGVFILGIPFVAWANSAIPIENPVDNKLMFDPNPGIRLVEEKVGFTFGNENGLYRARVDVSYVLKNEESEDKRADMIFVTPFMGEDSRFEARADGLRIETGDAAPFKDMPLNWEASKRMPVIEPISGRVLDKSPSSFDRGPVDFELGDRGVWGTRFSLELPAGEETVLEVSYESVGGIYRYQDVINQVHSQIYYMTPAAFYSGEPKVTLEVVFPEGLPVGLYSNIPLAPVEKNTYRAELDRLPEEEWLFSFAEKEGLALGTNRRAFNNYTVVACFGIAAGAAIWLGKKKKKKGLAVTGGMIAAGTLLLYKPAYGTLFLIYMAAPFAGGVGLLFFIAWAIRKYKSAGRRL